MFDLCFAGRCPAVFLVRIPLYTRRIARDSSKNVTIYLRMTTTQDGCYECYGLTVFVPRFSTRHLSTARSPGLTVILRGVGRNTDRGGYTAPLTAGAELLRRVFSSASALLTRVCRDDPGTATSSSLLLATNIASSQMSS